MPDRTQANTPVPSKTLSILDRIRQTGTLRPSTTNRNAPTTNPFQRPRRNHLLQLQPQTRALHSTPRTQTNPHPSSPPNQPSKQRTSTIPLPQSPLRAPSPGSLPFAPAAPAAAPRAPQNVLPGRGGGRIIEPTPDIRLPEKYKGAARRVTAIIVGIPVILVVGWELYGRWRGEVKKKWGEE